jgi:disulfide bond formation protein DsbB
MNSPLPAVPHNETFSRQILTDGLQHRLMEKSWVLIFCAWVVAAVATLGALFFGEVMQLPTCALCWYQRIFMFPLAIILPIGLFPFDRKVLLYTLPLAVLGWLFAVFHLLLVAGLIPEDIQPCTQGVPCSETVIEWFGFVTIPLLSAVAFSVIIALLGLAFFRSPK